MSVIDQFQFAFLKRYFPLSPSPTSDGHHRRELIRCFDASFSQRVKNSVVVDFGSGLGGDTIEMAKMGAALAIGVELREQLVEISRSKTQLQNCQFHTKLPSELNQKADLVISVDAFEHFEDPAFILKAMNETLKPEGLAMISFGPPWKHPHGGHLFSIFPWSHMLLSEAALIKWRSLYIKDGAKKFGEVEGGLNQLTIKQFEEYVARSPFEIVSMECVPIRGFALFQKLFSREHFTSCVQATLKKRA